MYQQRTPIRSQGPLQFPTTEMFRVTPQRLRPIVLHDQQQQSTAKTSSLEAQLEKQRKKIKALEATLLTTTTELRNMQLETTRLKVQAQHSGELINENNKKSEEILFYQDSLEMIKKEVESLNRNLQSKNRQHMEVVEEHEALKNDYRVLAEDRQDLTRMLGRGLDMLAELCRNLTIELSVNKESDPIDQLRTVCDTLNKSFRQLLDQRDLLIQVNDELRREYSDKLTKQRERSIRMEYHIKLLEDRKHDHDKQQEFRQTEEKDKRIELLELKLMHMEQQSERKLQEISQERFNHEDRMLEQSQEKENTLAEQTAMLTRRIKELEKDKKDLRAELEKTRERYKVLNDKYTRINFQAVHSKNSNDYLNYLKQLRTYEEEKKNTEIQLEQLTFRNRVLEQELSLYRPTSI